MSKLIQEVLEKLYFNGNCQVRLIPTIDFEGCDTLDFSVDPNTGELKATKHFLFMKLLGKKRLKILEKQKKPLIILIKI